MPCLRRGRQTDPSSAIFTLGTELGDLGLNVNSPEAIFSSFNPWAEVVPLDMAILDGCLFFQV
jgi:hypothetical protein